MNHHRPIRIMISWGDTAGHIFMGVAIADHVSARMGDADIAFVGAAGRLARQRMRSLGYAVHFLDIVPYDRDRTLRNLPLPFHLLRSTAQSLRLLRRHRPHVVMGLGGYPSAPFVYAAHLRKIPTLLVEPNLLPGLANRVLGGRAADRICLSFEESAAFFPPAKIVLTGTPVRPSVLPAAIPRKDACSAFSLDPGLKTVLIMGGSLGLAGINQAILGHVDALRRQGIQVIWQTGDRHFEGVCKALAGMDAAHLHVCPFLDDVRLAYAAADLAVTAGGAITMAELALWRKPAIVVPSSKATEGHQIVNAEKYAAGRACLHIPEENACEELMRTVIATMGSPSIMGELSEGIAAFARPEANDLILREILQLADLPQPVI